MAKKRVYPHVPNIQDKDIQSAVRILFDRIFDNDDIITSLRSDLDSAQSTIAELDVTTSKLHNQAQTAGAAAATTSSSGGSPSNPPPSPGSPPSNPWPGSAFSDSQWLTILQQILTSFGYSTVCCVSMQALIDTQPQLNVLGADWQHNSLGQLRERLYLPTANSGPLNQPGDFSRAFDVGAFGTNWVWNAV